MRLESWSSPRRRCQIAAVIAAVGLAGCSDTIDRPASVPRSDAEFLDKMVPHHEDAVVMVDEVLARGEDDEVRRIAERMKQDQLAEVEGMRALREELTGSSAPARKTAKDPHAKDDLTAMRELSGEALDQRFLRDMIAHHAEGVMTAHEARSALESEKTREMADKAFSKQTREMNEMLEMLEDSP